jgi:hypothetical protein
MSTPYEWQEFAYDDEQPNHLLVVVLHEVLRHSKKQNSQRIVLTFHFEKKKRGEGGKREN